MTDNKPTGNKAGNPHTTNREYERREGGVNHVPAEEAENTGAINPNEEDVKKPEQRHDKPDGKDSK